MASTSKNRPAGNLFPRQPHQPLPRSSGTAGNDVQVDSDQRVPGSLPSPAIGALSLPQGSSTDAGVSPVNAQANGDESDARMAEIKEILDTAGMLLDRCSLIAEWVHHAETKLPVFGQVVRKPQGGRPEGGVARAARELPVPGKSPEARRKFIERALKINTIWPEVKSAARKAGLDDNQSALIAIASKRSPDAQIKTAQEIAARKAMPRRRKSSTPVSSESTLTKVEHLKVEPAAGKERQHELGEELEAVPSMNAATSDEVIPPFLDRGPLPPDDQQALDALEAAWDRHLLPLWTNASPLVRERFRAARM
jgi:hypothetical protein